MIHKLGSDQIKAGECIDRIRNATDVRTAAIAAEELYFATGPRPSTDDFLLKVLRRVIDEADRGE